MFRIILLASIAPLLIACQTNSTSAARDSNPQATMGEAITEPSDGLDNEITADSDN